jgi:hypothetical protein
MYIKHFIAYHQKDGKVNTGSVATFLFYILHKYILHLTMSSFRDLFNNYSIVTTSEINLCSLYYS